MIRCGATIGANATIVCGVTIGRYAFIGAGAVVTRDVPDYALMLGNAARQRGWMSRHGHRLSRADSGGLMTCPESGFRYRLEAPDVLRCVDLDEDEPLPAEQAVGKAEYRSFAREPSAVSNQPSDVEHQKVNVESQMSKECRKTNIKKKQMSNRK